MSNVYQSMEALSNVANNQLDSRVVEALQTARFGLDMTALLAEMGEVDTPSRKNAVRQSLLRLLGRGEVIRAAGLYCAKNKKALVAAYAA